MHNIGISLGWLILEQILLIIRCWCILQGMEGNYEFVSCVILSKVLSKTGIGLFFIFSCRWLRTRNMRMSNFSIHILILDLNYQPTFSYYFYVFVSSDAVCRFEVTRTFSNKVSNVTTSECYFSSWFHIRILNKVKITNKIFWKW